MEGKTATKRRAERRGIDRRKSVIFNAVLNTINMTINSTFDVDEIMRRVVVVAADAMECESSGIALREDTLWETKYLYKFPQDIAGKLFTDDEVPQAVLAAQLQRPVAIEDTSLDERVNPAVMMQYHIRSVLVAPLMIKDEVIGALFFNYHSAPVSFNEAHIDFAGKVVAAVSLALANARLYDELKQAEENYRHLNYRCEMILKCAGDGILGLDEQGKHTFVNPTATEMFGYADEELVGRKSHLLWHHTKADGRPYPEGECPIHTTLKDGKEKAVSDEVFWRKDGTSFPVEYTTTPIIEDGTITGAVVTFRDITKRKQAEEALNQAFAELKRSNEELEQFAYIASHDLREPLIVVAAGLRVLELKYKGRVPSDADEIIADMLDGVNRMQNLINDLLAYCRVGIQGKPFQPVDTSLVLKHTLSNLRVALEQSGARVTHDPLPQVVADSTQLIQLMQNLIGNAVKFRKEKPLRIHLSVERGEAEWVFSVSDNGIGIPAEEKERIFELFHSAHRDKRSGTGIGLAVCKKIVERHGGRIWVESEPGRGATFYFTIPDKGIDQ